MKTTSPAAATALAALYAKDKPMVESSYNHLTADTLQTLDKQLLREFIKADGGREPQREQEECHLIIAQACIRRIAYRCLDKYAQLQSSQQVVEDALKYHTLPLDLQEQLARNYSNKNNSGGVLDDTPQSPPPTNWYEALEQLKTLATTTPTDADGSDNSGAALLDKGKLWRLILNHPMTAYVPVQCQACGHVVPDQYPLRKTDAEVGLQELSPTGTELELRAGWFRGPRKAVIFQLKCPTCQHVSRWYRSGHPSIILNPNKYGRLCGEQEDLRLTLADYLKIPVRLVVPLDWDHIWSEYQASESSWQVQDESARNFCCRLDEGIGSWTRVWAIHLNPDWCQDVTRDYLTCQQNGGRADDRINNHGNNNTMERYEQIVETAQKDALGRLTQAKSINGHVLARANLSDDEITMELQRAAREYGTKLWWQLDA